MSTAVIKPTVPINLECGHTNQLEEVDSHTGWISISVASKPFHFVEQLLQAGLELCTDGAGLITTGCAAAPHVGPLLRQRLGVL